MQLATKHWFGAFDSTECVMNGLTFWKALYDRDCFQVMKKVAYDWTKASQQKPFLINLGKNLVLSSHGELLALIRVHHLLFLLLSTNLQGRNYCTSGMRITQHVGQRDVHQLPTALLQKPLPSIKELCFSQVSVVTPMWQPKLCWDTPRPGKKMCRILRANLRANLSLLFSLVQRKHKDKYWMIMKVQNWKTRFRPRKKECRKSPNYYKNKLNNCIFNSNFCEWGFEIGSAGP